MPQDMPPTGGYEPVQYRRNLPIRGFRPAYYLAAIVGIMTYGYYKLAIGVGEQNELAREKMWARIHLIPLLQAEEDRDMVRRTLAQQAMEKELMGAESKVYHGDRYVLDIGRVLPEKGWVSMLTGFRFVRPTYAVTPSRVTKS